MGYWRVRYDNGGLQKEIGMLDNIVLKDPSL